MCRLSSYSYQHISSRELLLVLLMLLSLGRMGDGVGALEGGRGEGGREGGSVSVREDVGSREL